VGFRILVEGKLRIKTAGRLHGQPFLFFGVPKGIKQKGKQSYLIEIPFELKTAA